MERRRSESLQEKTAAQESINQCQGSVWVGFKQLKRYLGTQTHLWMQLTDDPHWKSHNKPEMGDSVPC